MQGNVIRGSSTAKDALLPNYKLGKTIGLGSSGKVKIAEHVLTGRKVAIKILDRVKMNRQMEDRVQNEIKCMRILTHPNIVRLYEVIETQASIFVVMEYVKNGELFDYVLEKGRLPEDEARRCFQQIIVGLEYCHKNMVVHRDLKPENLLLDSKKNVKIADFGFSNIIPEGHLMQTSCGSPNYAAPEVISGKWYSGPEVDVWSCGIILYVLLSGSLPFDDENFSRLFAKIKSGRYTVPGHVSFYAKDLIQRILVVDPLRRVTIADIRLHPWFQTNLPLYLALPLPNRMQQAKIDEEILTEVVKMGFNRNEVIESLLSKIQNQGTTAYYLLFDKKFHDSNGYHLPELPETALHEGCSNHTHASSSNPPAIPSPLPGDVDYQRTESELISHVGSKWTLGIESGANPIVTMNEVLRVLQELNVCWKKIGAYNLKCLWIPGITSSTTVLKFKIQLFRTSADTTVVDLQRVEGPELLFFELCNAFRRLMQYQPAPNYVYDHLQCIDVEDV
ncbi:hypothetical protein ACFE04_026624 [Oxalis oulophora]